MTVILREVFTFSVRFLALEIFSIVRCTLVPAVAGGLVFYFLLDGYFTELLGYLGHPSDMIASRVLGVVSAGALVLLLLNAVIVGSLTRLALDARAPERSFIGIGVTAWRIYTADFRLLLGIGGGGVLLWLVLLAMDRVWLSIDPAIIRFLCFFGIFLLGVRVWFFAAPLSVLGSPTGPLTDSWRYSSGHAVPVAIVLFVLLLFGIALEGAGELLLHALGLLSLFHSASLRESIDIYRRNLIAMVVLISACYLITTVLMTAARVHMYRRLGGALLET